MTQLEDQPIIVEDARDDLPFQIHWEIDEAPLSVWAFRVYANLVRRAGRDGVITPSYQTIAEDCFRATFGPDADERSLRNRAIKAVQELVDAGVIVKVERLKAGTDQNTSNRYVLVPRRQWVNRLKSTKAELQRATEAGRKTRRVAHSERKASRRAQAVATAPVTAVLTAADLGGIPWMLRGIFTMPPDGILRMLRGIPTMPKVITREVLQVLEALQAKEEFLGGDRNSLSRSSSSFEQARTPHPPLPDSARPEVVQAADAAGAVAPSAANALPPQELPAPPVAVNVQPTSTEKVPGPAAAATLEPIVAGPDPRKDTRQWKLLTRYLTTTRLEGPYQDGGGHMQPGYINELGRDQVVRLRYLELAPERIEEIGQRATTVHAAMREKARKEGKEVESFYTLVLRALDREIGADMPDPLVEPEKTGAGGGPLKNDPRLAAGARVRYGGRLGVVVSVTPTRYNLDLDDDTSEAVDRTNRAQLAKLEAVQGAPTPTVERPAGPGLPGPGSRWRSKVSPDTVLTVKAVQGATVYLEGGRTISLVELLSPSKYDRVD